MTNDAERAREQFEAFCDANPYTNVITPEFYAHMAWDAALRTCEQFQRELAAAREALRKARPDTVANINRLKRDRLVAKGVLAVSAADDAIAKAESALAAIDEALGTGEGEQRET